MSFEEKKGLCVMLSCPAIIVPFDLKQLLPLPLSFMTLLFFKSTGQLFCGRYVYLDLANISNYLYPK